MTAPTPSNLLNVSTDSLAFGPAERGPDHDLALLFEATSHLDPDERQLVRSIAEAMLLRYGHRRWARAN
jgi:hypothetical protein